jgi:prevent-host-death family protein
MMMRKISTGDARERFAEIINDAAEAKRTVITRHGKEIAAVVPIEDVQIPPGTMVIYQTPHIFNFTVGQDK